MAHLKISSLTTNLCYGPSPPLPQSPLEIWVSSFSALSVYQAMTNYFQMDTKNVAINPVLTGNTNHIFREQSAKKGAGLKTGVGNEYWIKLHIE